MKGRLPRVIRHVLRYLIWAITLENIKSNIRTLERDCRTLKDYYELIRSVRNPLLRSYALLLPIQKENEILRLLEGASRLQPRSVAEIGTGSGGVTYLLSKAAQGNATIVTLDINMPLWRKRLVEAYAQRKQTIIAIKADSHRQDTVRRVRESLHGNRLDLLFIDGDHSYDGVKRDFLNYSPLVRKGAWIVFHDIVPDFKTRYGIHMGGCAGGVPKFWSEIKHHHRSFEIVQDYHQDACGIGVLIWNGREIERSKQVAHPFRSARSVCKKYDKGIR